MLTVLVSLFVVVAVLGAIAMRTPRVEVDARAAPRLLAPPVRISFERPLDLGLVIEHRSAAPAGVASIVAADDLARALGLLTRAVRSALDAAAKSGLVTIDDRGVSITPHPSRVSWTRSAAASRAEALLGAIEEARTDLAAAAQLRPLAPSFDRLARRYGGDASACPLSLRATVHGVRLSVTAERTSAARFDLHVEAAFAPTGSNAALSGRAVRLVDRLARAYAPCATVALRDGRLSLRFPEVPRRRELLVALRSVLRAGRRCAETELSNASPYRDSPATVRARQAAG